METSLTTHALAHFSSLRDSTLVLEVSTNILILWLNVIPTFCPLNAGCLES